MLFRATKIVRVTSERDFDAALASADQLIVEGDDRLLSYAVANATKYVQSSNVDIQIGGHSISLGDDVESKSVIGGAETKNNSPVYEPKEVSFHVGQRAPVWIGYLALLSLIIAPPIAVFGYFSSDAGRGSEPAPVARSPSAPVPLAPDALGEPEIMLLQSLAWPLVAIVAIVALFFVARQAIAGGRNVEISWKVTEKVAGRVVITKVRSKADKVRSAA